MRLRIANRVFRMSNLLANKCSFQTQRLKVFAYPDCVKHAILESELIDRVVHIMTPEVTKSLPTAWQNIHSAAEAKKWLADVSINSNFLLVQLKPTKKIVGFVFLHESGTTKTGLHLRLGYLLSQDTWGLGIGGELIQGLLSWCKSSGKIGRITGGVEADNIASIKLLEKNGFVQTDKNSDGALVYYYDFNED